MLEESNRDYDNTIQLLQRKLNRYDIDKGTRNNNISADANIDSSMLYRVQQLKYTFSNKLELIRLELEHKLDRQEQHFKH